MNYKIQRRLFNICAFISLIKFRIYDKASDKTRERIRSRKLHKLVSKAYEIPFYRKRFEGAGVTPDDIRTIEDLVKLPLLTKDEYREWVESELSKEDNKGLMVMQTSGSSGKPLKVINTPFEYARDVASVLRSWMFCGANPFFLKTLTENDESSETVGYKTLIQKLGILRREMIDEDDKEENIISFINNYKPDIIRFYKSEMVRVAVYAEKNNLKLHKPQYFVVLGENVDYLSERLLRRNYGEGLINMYGCVEAGIIGVKRPGNGYYDLFEDAVAVNVYNESEELAEKGRLIMTTLYKNKYPLINYDLKDLVEIEQTAKGRIIKEIQGRLDDSIVYNDGDSTGWIRIWHIACKQEDLLQIHVIQDSLTHIVIQCVKRKDSLKKETDIETELRTDLDIEIKGRLEVSFEWKDSIPPDSNGKLKLIEKRFN